MYSCSFVVTCSLMIMFLSCLFTGYRLVKDVSSIQLNETSTSKQGELHQTLIIILFGLCNVM